MRLFIGIVGVTGLVIGIGIIALVFISAAISIYKVGKTQEEDLK